MARRVSDRHRGTRPATISDVASRARVSLATVSRVVNNDPTVRPHNRVAVQAAIQELHYQPRSRTHAVEIGRVGLVLPDITNPYFPLLIRGIGHAAAVQGAELVLCNSDGSPENERSHFDRLTRTGVDGIIYIPFSAEPNSLADGMVAAGSPIVFLDRELQNDDICSVSSDNKEGAFQATSYLLGLGHREIAFVSGPEHLSTSSTRYAGYRRGLSEHGVDCRPELLLYGDTTQETAYRVMLDFLRSSPPPFTAVFASNDTMAFGAWQALQQMGYAVPDDVSVIGYDDIPFSSFVSLTTIAQPAYEIGRNAFLLLADLIQKRREPPCKIVLRDSLIIRKSCVGVSLASGPRVPASVGAP